MTEKQTQSDTAHDLIAAALYLFGHKGYEGTSTRAIAERAGTNVASIAYHFGGKANLRIACAEAVAERISRVIADDSSVPLPDTPQSAKAEMSASVRGFVRLIVCTPEAQDFVSFVLRELAEPGEIADMLFARVFLPRHTRFCALWSVASGEPADSETVKISVFALLGQVIYFRLARPFVAKRMDWQAVGFDEADRIADTLCSNLMATIEGASQ